MTTTTIGPDFLPVLEAAGLAGKVSWVNNELVYPQGTDSATITAAEAALASYTYDAVKVAQGVQIGLLSAACQAAIKAGFTSSALGSAYNYPADDATQGNIDRAATKGGSLWCQPSSGGAWSFVAHTATEAAQAQADMWTHIQAQQTTYAGLVGQVNAATTVAGVDAIVWP